MFRKPPKKTNPLKIRKRDEEEDEDEDISLQDKIRSTQKKQKILSSLPLVTGNPSKRSTKKASASDAENATREMTVMEKKNHELMQQFIEEKLNNDKPTGTDNLKSDSNANKGHDDHAKDIEITDEETLYQQLAKEVYSKRHYEKEQVQEERDAVLVGGTGLAEVILPPSLSGKNNKGKQQSNRVYRKDDSSSAVPALSSMSNAKVTAGPQFRSFQQHHKRAPLAPQEDKDSENAVANNAKAPGDGDRPGFDAYRGKPSERKPIVKKQRDDSAFSDFVKHQREKMMNRR